MAAIAFTRLSVIPPAFSTLSDEATSFAGLGNRFFNVITFSFDSIETAFDDISSGTYVRVVKPTMAAVTRIVKPTASIMTKINTVAPIYTRVQ